MEKASSGSLRQTAQATERDETMSRKTIHEYRVAWEIDIYATSHREAAQQAWEIQRDPESTATVFDVYRLDLPERKLLNANEPVRIDLEEYRQNEASRKKRKRKRST